MDLIADDTYQDSGHASYHETIIEEEEPDESGATDELAAKAEVDSSSHVIGAYEQVEQDEQSGGHGMVLLSIT